MKTQKIGKYEVRARADAVDGGYSGTAHYTWHEPNQTLESSKLFDKVHATEEEAEDHALEQFALRVQLGEL